MTNSPPIRTAQIIRRLHFQEWGGTENVVWNTAQALVAQGNPVEILATTACGGDPIENRQQISILRFPYVYPYFPMGRARREILDKKGGNPLIPAMEQYLRRMPVDLLHCHNLGRLAQTAARVAQARHIPLVLSLHGGYFDIPEAEKEELCRPLRHTLPWGGMIERLLGWRCDAIQAADGIICVGANEADAFREKLPNKKILYLPNGVDLAKFQRRAAYDWRKALGIRPEQRLLLQVSRIDYQKNQLMLVDFLAELHRRQEFSHLLLIGPITAQWYGEKLRRRIQETGLTSYIHLVPGLAPDDDRLLAAYQQADCFLQPSLHEPFGIVVLEAWSAGLPVLAARVGGLARLVQDGETGLLFRPDSPAELMEAYCKLPDCAEQLVYRARQTVQAYSWEQIARKLTDFYGELVHAKQQC